LEANISEALDEYEAVGDDLRFSDDEKRKLIHHLSKDEARSYYVSYVKGVFSTYQEVKVALLKQYQTHIRQRTIYIQLMTLRISHVKVQKVHLTSRL
jgi:hypothetical protein